MQNLRYLLVFILSISIGVHSAPYGSKDIDISVDPYFLSLRSKNPEPISSIPRRGILISRHPPDNPSMPSIADRPPMTVLDSLVADGTLVPFSDPTVLNDKDDVKVFDRTLEGLTFGQEIKGGLNNNGVWNIVDFKEHTTESKLVAKFFKEADSQPFGEVKALRSMGLLVASGQVRDPRGTSLLPVVIMEKNEGVHLMNTNVYKKGDRMERDMMISDMLVAMCKQVVQDALKHKVYHHDNNLSNLFMTFINVEPVRPTDLGKSLKGIEVVDYGNSYKVMKEPSDLEERLTDACRNRYKV